MISEDSPESQSDSGLDPVRVHCRNIGGISMTDVSIPPGVTVLSGRNATNRTSLLRGIMGALGSDDVSLKGDADEGRVGLEFGGETYTRTLEKTDGGVIFGGDPFLEESEKADLFAFLLESNESRRAVARDDDLREKIMRPVNTAAIRSDIQRLEANKRQIDETLEEISDLEEELPGREEQRSRLVSEIESKRESLRELEAAIDEADASLDQSHENTADVEERLDELRSVRSSLEDVRFKLDTQRESLDALETERSAVMNDLSNLDANEVDMDELAAEIDRLRGRRSDLETEIGELQSIVRLNQEQLEQAGDELLGDEFAESGDGSVTDRLLEEDSIACWTCGTEVDRSAIEETLGRLRTVLDRKANQRRAVEERLSALTEQRKNHRERTQERRRLESRLDEIDREIEQREDRTEELERRRDQLEEDLTDLEDTVEQVKGNAEYRELVDLHSEANRIEIELDRTDDELASVEERISEIENRLEERERLEKRRDAIDEELTELRTRIETLETNAVDSFNEHMVEVLDRLEYANLERIWIERRITNEAAGPTDRETEFVLHVVRTDESGSAYEDTVDHLSESEREVTGLVFALAGYIAHEVYEECPFLVLDSLEAIDSERIDAVVDYVSEFTDYLVVALLAEDADAITVEHERVTDI